LPLLLLDLECGDRRPVLGQLADHGTGLYTGHARVEGGRVDLQRGQFLGELWRRFQPRGRDFDRLDGF
jgi:hypothetical protein